MYFIYKTAYCKKKKTENKTKTIPPEQLLIMLGNITETYLCNMAHNQCGHLEITASVVLIILKGNRTEKNTTGFIDRNRLSNEHTDQSQCLSCFSQITV